MSIDVMNIVVDVMNTTIIYAFVVMQMVNHVIPLKLGKYSIVNLGFH